MGRDKQQSVRKSNRVLIGYLTIKAAAYFAGNICIVGAVICVWYLSTVD